MTEAKTYPTPVSPPVATYACGECVEEATEDELVWCQTEDNPVVWEWVCPVCAEFNVDEQGLQSSDLTIADYHEQQRSV